MSQVADEDLDEAPAPDPAHSAERDAAREPRRAPVSDAYAGLDEVTRAKRRLLDYGREQEPDQPRPQRRVAFRSAIVAFVAGFVVGGMPILRARTLRALRWTVKQMRRVQKRMDR